MMHRKNGKQSRIVLLVDDDERIVRAYQRFLKSHVVVTASSGYEALTLVHRGLTPDVVLADLDLGDDLDGLTLLARLWRLVPSARLILATGCSEPVVDEKRVVVEVVDKTSPEMGLMLVGLGK